MSDRVTISISDGIADVRFNRADKRNALDGEQFQAIVDAGESLKTNKKIRVVVLSGEGPSFCAGLDFSSFQAMAGGDNAEQAAARWPVSACRVIHRVGALAIGGHDLQRHGWAWTINALTCSMVSMMFAPLRLATSRTMAG